jgi:hypothetical protein
MLKSRAEEHGMKEIQIDDTTVVLDDSDEWLEYLEHNGMPELRVSDKFAGKRLIMTERIRQKMIDGLRRDVTDEASRAHAEAMMSATIAAFGVEVIADA